MNVVRRVALILVSAIVSLVGVLTLVFVLARLSGDPAKLMAPPNAPQSQIDLTRAQLGLDRPLIRQYGSFLRDAVHGDFGKSYYWHQSAASLVWDHLPSTLALAAVAATFAIILGVGAGLVASSYRGRLPDRVMMTGSLVGQAVPAFWMAPVLILLVSVKLGWTPTGGMNGWRSFVLPMIALGSFQLAVIFRITRASALEVQSQDHVRLGRAKGLGKGRLAISHILPSTALPVITVAGLSVASLIGGSVIVERIFSWPGLGNLMIDAVEQRDFPVVQAIAVVYAVAFITINTLVDLLYELADPRTRTAVVR
ncbi:MAG: transporter permease [Ilumatobacteraceae bacterium]|nr:transporter permease [Ilumatobacteraceae bacterium]